MPDFRAYADTFRRDGVVYFEGVLDSAAMEFVDAAFRRKLENPGPLTQQLYPERGNIFLNSRGQSFDDPVIARCLRATGIAEIVAGLFGTGPVWFFEEQIFLKDARHSRTPVRRTPWHQDGAFYPFAGSKSAVVWISLDPLPRECALEVIRGSHVGPLYNAPRFAGDDDTAPFFADSDRPRLPDIEASRERWDIAGWPAARGDVLVFHSHSLHGGGATPAGMLRRSLTLRFIGDDVLKGEVPEKRGDTLVKPSPNPAVDALAIGQPYHECGLHRVHPGWSD